MCQLTVLITATLLLLAVCPSGCKHIAQSKLEQATTVSTRLNTQRNVGAFSTRATLLAQGGAIKAVGRQHLERIARDTALGVNVTTLAGILDTDQDLLLDASGERLLQTCTGLATAAEAVANRQARQQQDHAAAATAAAAALVAQQLAGLTIREVFSLSSRPISANKIILDFDGHTVTGTDWNYPGYETIVIPPWDTDKNPASFSATELAQIKAMWRKVAEDFAPFDVDVTTLDAGDAALLGTGQRIIIGGNNNVLPMFTGAGGSCWVGSFGTRNPCLVFQKPLYSDVKVVANAISHELGHGLGLLHDGTNQEHGKYEYFTGYGNVWGPIMGMPYNANITQWDKGEYLGSNNYQNDIAVISARIAVLPQLYGDRINTATLLPADGLVQGIISNPGQSDFFYFSARPGPVSIKATGPGILINAAGWAYPTSNLDMQLTLYNSAGAVISTVNPPGSSVEALEASMQVTLQDTGVYYISVGGAGAGNPKSNGYSSYGSLGQYTLRVSYSSGPQASPAPSPVASPAPSPSPSVPAPSPEGPSVPSPSPATNGSQSPSPLPEGTAVLSFLTSWPLHSPITTADITAGKLYSTSELCIKKAAPALNSSGTSILAPGYGRCNVESSGVVSAGFWFMSAAAPAPAEVDYWECYNVTDGTTEGPFIIMGPTGAGIAVQSSCSYTCVAVFTVPGYSYGITSPSPSLEAQVSPSPSPLLTSTHTASLALLSSFPASYIGPRADLSATSDSSASSCVKAPAPRAGDDTITVLTPGPGMCESEVLAGKYGLYAEAPPDTLLKCWECWTVTYNQSSSSYEDNCTTVTLTTQDGATVIQTNCTSVDSTLGAEQQLTATATLLSTNISTVNLEPNVTVTCVAVFVSTQLGSNMTMSPSPWPSASPSTAPPPLLSPAPFTQTMNVSVKYTSVVNSLTGGSFYGLFTVSVTDTVTKKRVSGVSVNATVSLSPDNRSTDPQNRYPYSINAVLPRSGQKTFRTYKVRTMASRQQSTGTSILFQINSVKHSLYALAEPPQLLAITPKA